MMKGRQSPVSLLTSPDRRDGMYFPIGLGSPAVFNSIITKNMNEGNERRSSPRDLAVLSRAKWVSGQAEIMGVSGIKESFLTLLSTDTPKKDQTDDNKENLGAHFESEPMGQGQEKQNIATPSRSTLGMKIVNGNSMRKGRSPNRFNFDTERTGNTETFSATSRLVRFLAQLLESNHETTTEIRSLKEEIARNRRELKFTNNEMPLFNESIIMHKEQIKKLSDDFKLDSEKFKVEKKRSEKENLILQGRENQNNAALRRKEAECERLRKQLEKKNSVVAKVSGGYLPKNKQRLKDVALQNENASLRNMLEGLQAHIQTLTHDVKALESCEHDKLNVEPQMKKEDLEVKDKALTRVNPDWAVEDACPGDKWITNHNDTLVTPSKFHLPVEWMKENIEQQLSDRLEVLRTRITLLSNENNEDKNTTIDKEEGNQQSRLESGKTFAKMEKNIFELRNIIVQQDNLLHSAIFTERPYSVPGSSVKKIDLSVIDDIQESMKAERISLDEQQETLERNMAQLLRERHEIELVRCGQLFQGPSIGISSTPSSARKVRFSVSPLSNPLLMSPYFMTTPAKSNAISESPFLS